jgi:hypothetical protein
MRCLSDGNRHSLAAAAVLLIVLLLPQAGAGLLLHRRAGSRTAMKGQTPFNNEHLPNALRVHVRMCIHRLSV